MVWFGGTRRAAAPSLLDTGARAEIRLGILDKTGAVSARQGPRRANRYRNSRGSKPPSTQPYCATSGRMPTRAMAKRAGSLERTRLRRPPRTAGYPATNGLVRGARFGRRFGQSKVRGALRLGAAGTRGKVVNPGALDCRTPPHGLRRRSGNRPHFTRHAARRTDGFQLEFAPALTRRTPHDA